MKKKYSRENYGHIAVNPELHKRFEYLKSYLITPEKTKITQEDLLESMMNLFEKNYNKNES